MHAFLETTEELALDAAARIDAAVAEGASPNGPARGRSGGYKDNLNLTGTRRAPRTMLLVYVSP